MRRIFVIALGNPGQLYALTRHNAGWIFADFLCEKLNIRLKPGKGEFYIGSKDKIFVVKPTTYMNNSGVAVRQVVEQHGVDDLQELLIVLDDTNLPLGRMRLRMKGSSGGHRGLESVIYHLGTHEFPRLRFGIGSPPQGVSMRDYVLSPFDDSELEKLKSLFDRAFDGIKLMLEDRFEEAMQLVNTAQQPAEGQ